jgi:hypothetical protein
VKLFPKVLLLLGICFISFSLVSYGQADTVQIQTHSTIVSNTAATVATEDDEFNIFLFTFASVFLAAMAGVALIAAIVTALILFFLFALLSLGVLSTSFMVGLYKKSIAAGFKIFIVLVFTGGGTLIGIIGLWLTKHIFYLSFSDSTSLLIGAASGAIAGILLGLATFKMLQYLIPNPYLRGEENTGL